MPKGERKKKYTKYSQEFYYVDGSKLTVDKNPYTMCRAKFYYKNADGTHSPSSNEGDYIDFNASIFGRSLVYFEQGGKYWVSKSRCEIVKTSMIRKVYKKLIGKYDPDEVTIREWNIGAFSRVLIRNKWQHAKIENQ